MSPLLRKEIRLLLLPWVAALAAATFPLWRWRDYDGILPLFFEAAILTLTLSPFGQESSNGTFGLLLVQPVARRHFWRIKTGLLAIALLSAWSLFAWCLLAQSKWNADSAMILQWSGLMMFVAFSGGLWSTLLLRDMVSAFFLTLIIPSIICTATLLCLSHWVPNGSDTLAIIIFCVLGTYAAAGFLWARHLFFDGEDAGWSGGQIPGTKVRGVSWRWLASEWKGKQSPSMALIKKELQLQEATMLLVPLLAVLYVATIAIYYLSPHWADRNLLLGTIPAIWMAAVPLVIGCVGVAEERRINTLEGSLCLPMRKRTLFGMKLLVALILGAVLGGIVPWTLGRVSGEWPRDFQLPTAMLIAVGITGTAFYASTMSRGLLSALPTTLCILALSFFAFSRFSFYGLISPGGFARSLIFPALFWPVMTITIVWLAFVNFKRAQVDWRLWAGNLIAVSLMACCATLVSMAIFDRFWQSFETLEPAHGPARITGPGRASLSGSVHDLYALLSDGRLWIGKKERSRDGISGGFAPGSNWTDLTVNFQGAAVIQSNGTLWAVSNKADLHQVGSDSDWRKVAGHIEAFIALKQNGTLWGWGHDYDGEIIKNTNYSPYYGIKIPEPVRIGTDSDWVNVFLPANQEAIGVKRDGSIWKWSGREKVRLKISGTNWMTIAGCGQMTLALRDDGSLWAFGDYIPPKIFGAETSRAGVGVRRLEGKSDWVALNGDGGDLAAVESNGTLWAKDFRHEGKRPSKYTDWLAATGDFQFTWALAKDGTLTCWDVFGTKEPDDRLDRPPTFIQRFFLGPNRRPVFSVNIFDEVR
jgi:hypothetical protein